MTQPTHRIDALPAIGLENFARASPESLVALNEVIAGYSHTEYHADGTVVHYDRSGAIYGDNPIDGLFGLTYASWVAIPRLVLQEMPLDWQARFVALMSEGFDTLLVNANGRTLMPLPEGIEIKVRDGSTGRFVKPREWNNYRRGKVATALESTHDD